MSSIKLIQRIRELSKQLQQAYNDENYDLADDLEDELTELEEILEEEEEIEYNDRHQHSWY
jgi:hypothetical protein